MAKFLNAGVPYPQQPTVGGIDWGAARLVLHRMVELARDGGIQVECYCSPGKECHADTIVRWVREIAMERDRVERTGVVEL